MSDIISDVRAVGEAFSELGDSKTKTISVWATKLVVEDYVGI